MVLPDAQLSDIFRIFQEFGPRRRIPISERWSEAFPNATADEMREWRSRCEEIEAFAYALAREFGPDLRNDLAFQKIQTQFPQLHQDQVSAAWNQARYFAWRDGS